MAGQRILDNKPVIKAVEQIVLRAEHLDEYQSIYVDAGQLSKLRTTDSQIIYGRRGTGKTHLLGAYKESLDGDVICCYVDVRHLQDTTISPSHVKSGGPAQSMRSFQQLVQHVAKAYAQYIEQALKGEYRGTMTPDEALNLVVALMDTAQGELHATGEVQENSTTGNESSSQFKHDEGYKVKVSPKDVSVDIEEKGSQEFKNQTKSSSTLAGTKQIRVSFAQISDCIRSLNVGLGVSQLIILLDEWSSLPLDIQPFFGEWIRRSFLATKLVSVKIAALPYLKNFSFTTDATRTGLEVSGDIFVGVDLDDILVFDKNKGAVTKFFANLLYKHLTKDVPEIVSARILTDPAVNLHGFINQLFSQVSAFEELMKASEGIPRDFLHIFSSAFFRAQEHPQWSSIGVPAVVAAAKDWYERDKVQNVQPELRSVLERLVNEVIKQRKVKAFLVPTRLSDSHALQLLLNSRLLHQWHKGYASKSGPVGERYDIYAIDYGAYVDLRDTTYGRELHESMFEDDLDNVPVPPSIDNRAVRHIVLEEALLNAYDALLAGSIECPTCRTRFNPNQKSFRVKRLCPECFEPIPTAQKSAEIAASEQV